MLDSLKNSLDTTINRVVDSVFGVLTYTVKLEEITKKSDEIIDNNK